MPREVKAWVCEHGCGYKCQTHKARIVKHEARCYSNPANRSCRTCHHERTDDYSGDFVCECAGAPGPENGWLDDPAWTNRPGWTDDDLPFDAAEIGNTRRRPQIRWDCPGWSQR
jgi:hypothetical protein